MFTSCSVVSRKHLVNITIFFECRCGVEMCICDYNLCKFYMNTPHVNAAVVPLGCRFCFYCTLHGFGGIRPRHHCSQSFCNLAKQVLLDALSGHACCLNRICFALNSSWQGVHMACAHKLIFYQLSAVHSAQLTSRSSSLAAKEEMNGVYNLIPGSSISLTGLPQRSTFQDANSVAHPMQHPTRAACSLVRFIMETASMAR